MIQAIEQRRQTMLKVMNFIVDRQREFFEKGVEYLKPLTLREVADVINMHESTVSRVTNEKYVQTPRGLLPLKFFFSSGLSTTTGEDASARSDRKSTRLNSSHLVISYAVFCLKKKKKTHQTKHTKEYKYSATS